LNIFSSFAVDRYQPTILADECSGRGNERKEGSDGEAGHLFVDGI
jgi:hypothetical protein